MSDIEWTPDERTVRAVLEAFDAASALPSGFARSILAGQALRELRGSIESLLPKPDPDVEVVRKVLEAFAGQCPADCDVDFQDALAAYKANKP